MRGFGADADELFFSLADYARNPSQKQVLRTYFINNVQPFVTMTAGALIFLFSAIFSKLNGRTKVAQ